MRVAFCCMYVRNKILFLLMSRGREDVEDVEDVECRGKGAGGRGGTYTEVHTPAAEDYCFYENTDKNYD